MANTSRSIKAREKEAMVMEMRKRGMSYDAIGQFFGFTAQRASKIYSNALNNMVKEPAEDIITTDVERVDTLIEAMWEGAVKLKKPHFVDRIVALMDYKAKLLGLYAPTISRVITHDVIDSEILRLEQEIAAIEVSGHIVQQAKGIESGEIS